MTLSANVDYTVECYSDVYWLLNARGGADKSLARPGRKQATATKIGIYSSTPHEAQYTP